MAFLLTGTMLHAQESDFYPSDSTDLQSKKITLGIVPSYSVSQLKGSILSFAGLGVDMQFDERMDARVFVAFNIDNYSLELLFPSEHSYNQSTAGMDVSWKFFKKSLSPMAGAMVNYSKIYWKPMDSEGEQFHDYLWLVSPYVGGNWDISKLIRLQVRGGYNFSGKMDLVGFEQGDFDSFYLETILIVKIADL
jgi:hypothetical protein